MKTWRLKATSLFAQSIGNAAKALVEIARAAKAEDGDYSDKTRIVDSEGSVVLMITVYKDGRVHVARDYEQ